MLKFIKKLSVIFLLSMFVVACTPSTKNVKSPPAEKPRSSEKSASSSWKRTYGEAQERTRNSLPEQSDRRLKLKYTSPQSVTDLWQRLRNGYGLANPASHPKVQKELKWFAAHPEYVARVAERARPYLYYIVREIEKRKMPMEIALLPVVESGFQPYAYSSGHAAGLWQFIPGTGTAYGLKQDWWYDGRRDVIESTRAALTYLQKLHNDFGDWQLALAAYNCGEGTVGRAIRANKKAGKPTDFWSLSLPKETSVYVPKLLAIAHLIDFPEAFNLTLKPIKNAAYFSVVNTGSQIDLTIAAKLAKMTTDEMYNLNPGFNRWATRPDGPHRLVLPLKNAMIFQQALVALPDKDRIQWVQHKVKSGESVGGIAQKHNISTASLKQANKLTSNKIRAGMKLLIPLSSGKNAVNPSISSKQLAAKKKVKSKKKKTHTVKAGDTWWDLAKAYNVSIKSLTKWNGKSAKDTLRLGQKLIILTQNKRASSSKKAKSINYKIKGGDSLWAIARKFNVHVSQVREWNGMSDRTLLKPGQNLTIFPEKNSI